MMTTWSKKLSFNPATELETEVWEKILDKFIALQKKHALNPSTCQITDFACSAMLYDREDELDNQAYSQGELFE
jgi:hypothetical protein